MGLNNGFPRHLTSAPDSDRVSDSSTRLITNMEGETAPCWSSIMVTDTLGSEMGASFRGQMPALGVFLQHPYWLVHNCVETCQLAERLS